MIYQIPIKTLPNVLKVGHIRYSSGWSETYTHDLSDKRVKA